MSRVLAASLIVAAAATLLAPGEIVGFLAAAGVTAAVLAVWSTGSAGPGNPTRKVGTRLDRATSAGLAVSLGAGCLLAAGIADGPSLFGLPRSLWGLLLGVWLIPLVLTSLGFAAAFEPPDPAGLERLERLRPGARE